MFEICWNLYNQLAIRFIHFNNIQLIYMVKPSPTTIFPSLNLQIGAFIRFLQCTFSGEILCLKLKGKSVCATIFWLLFALQQCDSK